MTDICNQGEFETRYESLDKVVGPQFKTKYLAIKQLQKYIKTLLKDPENFPSLPTQSVPEEGYFFEELSDLFENTKNN